MVHVSEKTVLKIREKHGLDWDDVGTVFDNEEMTVEVRNGDTGITFGITASGKAVTVITVRKGKERWVKTARYMTASEKRLFRNKRR